MNKKLLLVALLPVAMNANLDTLKADVNRHLDDVVTLLSSPFGENQARLNSLVAVVATDVAQAHVGDKVKELDAKFLAKTYNGTYVTVTSGDVVAFAAAVATSCALEKVSGKAEALTVRNAAEHGTARLVVGALEIAHAKATEKVTSVLGVEFNVEETINARLPKHVAQAVNYVRSVYTKAAVYSVVKNEVASVFTRLFAPKAQAAA